MKYAPLILAAAIGARVLLEANKNDARGSFLGPILDAEFVDAVIDARTESIANGIDLAILGAGLAWVL